HRFYVVAAVERGVTFEPEQSRMDWTNRHPADQLALKAASLMATSSLKPTFPRSPRRLSRRHNDQPKNQSWVGGDVCGGAEGASPLEPRTYDCPGDLYGQDPI